MEFSQPEDDGGLAEQLIVDARMLPGGRDVGVVANAVVRAQAPTVPERGHWWRP